MKLTRRDALFGGLCCCSAVALSGCATTASGDRIAPNYKPVRGSVEDDLWGQMNRVEERLKRSRELVRDEAIIAYLRDIACRLAAKHCADLRVYLVRTPVFNATMAPNGMMSIYTGLLLRAQNEAQLAAVLGHEIGHYLARHTLQRFEVQQATRTATGILSMGLGAAGLGGLGPVAEITAIAGLQAYSRDHEREADEIGFELMSEAGYRPIESARVWEQIMEEEEAGTNDSPNFLFSSHPPTKERIATLRKRAEQRGQMRGEVHAERYHEKLRTLRPLMFEDELRRREFARSLVLFGQIAKARGEDGELAFWTGEAYRLRDRDGDRARAREAYARALAHPDAPAATHRSLGLLAQREGDQNTAAAAFRRYLELAPDAPDRDMIRSFLRG